MTPFSEDTIRKAWKKRGGLCAACGKKLIWANRTVGTRGSWQPHHRKPRSYEGLHSLGNCALLCINPPNCHLNRGHKGNTKNRVGLYDYELNYFYGGNPFTPSDIKTPLDRIKTPLDRIKTLL